MNFPVSSFAADAATTTYPEISAHFGDVFCYPIEALDVLANEYNYQIMPSEEYFLVLLNKMKEKDSKIHDYYIQSVRSNTAGAVSSESVGPPTDTSQEQLEFRKLRRKIWKFHTVIQGFKLDGHLPPSNVWGQRYDVLKTKVDEMLDSSEQLSDDDVQGISKIIEDSQVETSPVYKQIANKVTT